MTPVRTLARPMLAAIFVKGGTDALLDPDGHAPVAEDVVEPVKDAAPQLEQASTSELVQLNGAAQLLGGLLLATGRLPRVAAALLAGSIVPTTLAAHRFWEEDDPEAREAQRLHFLKNLGLLGGLLLATLDREGRPGMVWRGKHAVDHARLHGEHAREVAGLRTELTKEKLTPDVLDAKRAVEALRGDEAA